jgi:hypothetical protein
VIIRTISIWLISIMVGHSGRAAKARTLFARSNPGIVGSNPTQGMVVCVRLFCVCAVLCVGRGLATSWSLVQVVLPTVFRIRKLKSGQGPKKDCRAMMMMMMLMMMMTTTTTTMTMTMTMITIIIIIYQ